MRPVVFAVALCLSAQVAAASPDKTLDVGGTYDSIAINGLVLPARDVDQLLAAGILRLDAKSRHFSLGPEIGSERQLAARLQTLSLENPEAVLELYRSAKVAMPNGAAHELTVPSGFGPAHYANEPGKVILSASLGGVSRVPYTSSADGALGLGLSFGNGFKGIGASVMMSFNDLSNFGNPDRISFGFALNHYLADGLSIAVGGENLFVKITDGEPSFYVAGSWAFTTKTSVMPFNGTATIGAGSGRFATMTARDNFEGKTGPATAVFGSVAWEATQSLNVIAEWNGRNLNCGLGYTLPGTPISFKLGVEDLTGYSGDGPIVTGSVGVVLARF